MFTAASLFVRLEVEADELGEAPFDKKLDCVLLDDMQHGSDIGIWIGHLIHTRHAELYSSEMWSQVNPVLRCPTDFIHLRLGRCSTERHTR